MPVTPVEISQLWRHVNRHMRSLFRSYMSEHDMPLLSYLLLRRIEEEPGITLTELARRVGSSKSHTSTMVDHLAQEGYVEKRSDPTDQRVIRLHVTQEAERSFERMGERAGQVWAIVLQELPEAEIDDVERFLRTLLRALERANARIHDAAQRDVDLPSDDRDESTNLAGQLETSPTEVHRR